MIIGLIGKARSGKSTVAQHFATQHGFQEVSFAQALKEMVINAILRNPPPNYRLTYDDLYKEFYVNRTPYSRWLLQFVGTDIVRKVNPDYWVDNAPLSHFADVVVADVRFPNEAKAIKDRGGIIIRIIRSDAGGKIEHGAEHQSETALDDYKADYEMVSPSGVGNLLEVAEATLKLIKGGPNVDSEGRKETHPKGGKREEKASVEPRSE